MRSQVQQLEVAQAVMVVAVTAVAVTAVLAVTLVVPAVVSLAPSVLTATVWPTQVGMLSARGAGLHSRPQGAATALAQRLNISPRRYPVKPVRPAE